MKKMAVILMVTGCRSSKFRQGAFITHEPAPIVEDLLFLNYVVVPLSVLTM